MKTVFLTLGITLAAACRVAPPPAGAATDASLKAQQAGPDAEKALKAQATAWPLREDTSTVEAKLVRLPLADGQRLMATNVLARRDDLVIVDNRRGTLFTVARRDPERRPAKTEPYRVLFPMTARAVSDGIYVYDENGLTLFGRDGAIAKRTRLFRTVHDFLPLADRSLLLNAPTAREPGVVLAILDGAGHPGGMWEERRPQAAPLGGPVSSAAYLARCGDRVGVAMKHSPHFYVVTPSLETVADVTLDFPSGDALNALANRPDLARPNEHFVWQPDYIAGVDCLDDRFVVLLDLPVVRLYELSMAGEILKLYRNDDVRLKGSLKRLAAVNGAEGWRLYSIVENENRDVILEMSIPGRPAVHAATKAVQ